MSVDDQYRGSDIYQAMNTYYESKYVVQATPVLMWVSHISVDVRKDAVAAPECCKYHELRTGILK